MPEKFRLDGKIGFLNMFYTKCTNVIIDSIGPSIFLRSILYWVKLQTRRNTLEIKVYNMLKDNYD